MADWSHQPKAESELVRHFKNGAMSAVLVLPTGGGKTRTAGIMMWKAWKQKGHKSIFVADRRELVLQPARAFQALGFDVGITMADSGSDEGGTTWCRPDAPIQICSKQTLTTGRYQLPDARFVVTDECHLSITEVHAALMKNWPNAWEIGLTATPVRGDGKGLGRRYQAIVTGATYQHLQTNGVLVPVQCKAPKSKVQRKSQGGLKPTGKTMTGDPVGWWKKLGENRLTFAFSKNVAASKGLRDEFRRQGIAAGHIDGRMRPDEVQDELLAFRRGEIRVICNCNMLKYGVDVPQASCLLINAPFGSFTDFRQASGRIMRAYPGKVDCLVIDMAGAVNYHGFPDEDMEWCLDDDRCIDGEYKSAMKDGKKPQPITCPTCYEVFKARSTCPACGWEIPVRRGTSEENRNGTLTDVQREECGLSAREWTQRDIQNAWHKALAIAANMGRTCRVAAGIFRGNTKGSGIGKLEDAGIEPLPRSWWEWNKSVAEVFPEFVRKRKPA